MWYLIVSIPDLCTLPYLEKPCQLKFVLIFFANVRGIHQSLFGNASSFVPPPNGGGMYCLIEITDNMHSSNIVHVII